MPDTDNVYLFVKYRFLQTGIDWSRLIPADISSVSISHIAHFSRI